MDHYIKPTAALKSSDRWCVQLSRLSVLAVKSNTPQETKEGASPLRSQQWIWYLVKRISHRSLRTSATNHMRDNCRLYHSVKDRGVLGQKEGILVEAVDKSVELAAGGSNA